MAERICSYPGCGESHLAQGWCSTHYARWRRHGTPDDLRPTTEQRFWAKVERTDTCWLWTGAKLQSGYANLWVQETGRTTVAHRWAYEHYVGPIPEGLTLDHLCRVRHCVRPSHLEPVTHHENVLRGISGALTTHCPKGHPYDEANTYIARNRLGNPSRTCRTCHREQQRRYDEAARQGGP